MTDFDKNLRHSLNADDQAFLEDLESGHGLFTQMGATFQGPLRIWTYLVVVFTFIFFVLAAYAGWQAVIAQTDKATILWCALALWLALAVAMLKLWVWERTNLLTVLREVKKLELRIAQLQDKAE